VYGQKNNKVLWFLLVAVPILVTGRGDIISLSFMEAVVAGIIAYYICKWLDDKFFHGNN